MYDGDRFRRYELPRTLEGAEAEYEIAGEGPIDRIKEILGPVVETAKPIVRQNWKIIVAGIAALVVVYFLYSYFIGSVRSVEISVVDTEGLQIGNAGVRIYAKGSTTAVESFTGSKKVSLRIGEYDADVVAAGYKTLRRNLYGFEITPDTTEKEIVLEQNIDVELSVVDFPQQLFTGEVRKVVARVTNTGQQGAVVEVVAEGNLKSDATVSSQPVTISPGSSADIELQIAVGAGIGSRTGRKGSLRVKGTLEEQSFAYGIVEFNSADVRVSKTDIDFGTVDGGERVERTFDITNNGGADMAGIEFSVESISAQSNSGGEVKGWFSFNPARIGTLGRGTANKRTVSVILDVPLDAKTDRIDGLIVLSTTYWEREMNIDLDVKAVAATMTIEGLGATYSLTKDSSGNYRSETDPITIRSTGDIGLNDVRVSTDCDSQWIAISNASLGNIEVGGRATTVLTIKAPRTFADNSSHVCNLRLTYQDPRSPLTAPNEEMRTIIISS